MTGRIEYVGDMFEVYVGTFLFAVASTLEDAQLAALAGQATYDDWVQKRRAA